MNKTTLVVIAIVVGFAAGWSVCIVRQSQTPGHSDQSPEDAANTKELARLYPAQHALDALKDMRVLTLLKTNDVVMARRLLIQDLESHTSVLSALSRGVQLSEFDTRALKDAETFLQEIKR